MPLETNAGRPLTWRRSASAQCPVLNPDQVGADDGGVGEPAVAVADLGELRVKRGERQEVACGDPLLG